MERRTFTREFKCEAVKLIQERGGDGGASLARFGLAWHGVAPMGSGVFRRFAAGLPGQGQMKPEQAELARLRREVIKLKAERDIF